jgi:hypothetical protein
LIFDHIPGTPFELGMTKSGCDICDKKHHQASPYILPFNFGPKYRYFSKVDF